MPKAKPISLNPLKLDDIIRAALKAPVSTKPVSKKRSKSKSASKSRA